MELAWLHEWKRQRRCKMHGGIHAAFYPAKVRSAAQRIAAAAKRRCHRPLPRQKSSQTLAAGRLRPREAQTNLVLPGIATSNFGGGASQRSWSGISTSWLFQASSQVMRLPVYAAMRPISAISVLLHM